jgi:hypothetical protein
MAVHELGAAQDTEARLGDELLGRTAQLVPFQASASVV